MFAPFTTTGIGSMPHRDPGEACRTILERVDVPFWPQLPNRSFRELMVPQYAEHFPGIRIVPGEQRVWVDDDPAALTGFYESYTEASLLGLSEDSAAGWHAFAGSVRDLDAVKGHVTGPLTFTLGLKDARGIPVYFNEELREICLMVLKGNIRWQIAGLRKLGREVLVFIDEPILSAIGTSAYMGVSEEETRRLLAEVVSEIRRNGGIAAIHCCGKADWGMVLATGIDAVNFDAFEYYENFQIYIEQLSAFLERGGRIAFGIVPTSQVVMTTTVGSLREKLLRQVEDLERRTGFKALPGRALLTPSCGTGSLSEAEAGRVFETLQSLKRDVTK